MVKHPGGVAILAWTGKPRVDGRAVPLRDLSDHHGDSGRQDGQDSREALGRPRCGSCGGDRQGCRSLGISGENISIPGIVSEVLYLYLATGLHEEERELDSDEFINLKLMELGTVRKGHCGQGITDCKTIAALAMAELKGLIE